MVSKRTDPAPLEGVERLIAEIGQRKGLSFSQLAAIVPPSSGKPVNTSTIWRWSRRGVKTSTGEVVRLESIRLAGRWLTTEGALERFLRAQQVAVEDVSDKE